MEREITFDPGEISMPDELVETLMGEIRKLSPNGSKVAFMQLQPTIKKGLNGESTDEGFQIVTGLKIVCKKGIIISVKKPKDTFTYKKFPLSKEKEADAWAYSESFPYIAEHLGLDKPREPKRKVWLEALLGLIIAVAALYVVDLF